MPNANFPRPGLEHSCFIASSPESRGGGSKGEEEGGGGELAFWRTPPFHAFGRCPVPFADTGTPDVRGRALLMSVKTALPCPDLLQLQPSAFEQGCKKRSLETQSAKASRPTSSSHEKLLRWFSNILLERLSTSPPRRQICVLATTFHVFQRRTKRHVTLFPCERPGLR